jgi:hypothetical protein
MSATTQPMKVQPKKKSSKPMLAAFATSDEVRTDAK